MAFLYQSLDKKQSYNAKTLEVFKVVGLVLFYYIFAIGLTFYNKWMFNSFHFPLITSSIHFLTVFLISGLARIVFKSCKDKNTYLSWSNYFKNVVVTGVASALDIGLSNWSFVFITVSLYTMVKSSAVIFILGFALIFKLEKPKVSLIFVILLISSGLFMFVFKSSQFDLEGFLLVLGASFLGGLRWTMSQILTQKQDLKLSNPIDLLFHLQPIMFLGIFPLAIIKEGVDFFTIHSGMNFDYFSDFVPSICMIGFGAILAFMLSFSEYLLLSQTSSLTLAISGIFKEVCILVMATTINGDQLSSLNICCFFACVLGICLHVYLKFRNELHKKVNPSSTDQINLHLLNNQFSDSDNEVNIFEYEKS